MRIIIELNVDRVVFGDEEEGESDSRVVEYRRPRGITLDELLKTVHPKVCATLLPKTVAAIAAESWTPLELPFSRRFSVATRKSIQGERVSIREVVRIEIREADPIPVIT